MKRLIFLSLLFIAFTTNAQNKIPSKKVQIKTAIQAAPKTYRDGAKVLGYDTDGKLITLRKGTNNMVCLADDPEKDGISVACYSDKLEPYMARGRQLIAQGKTEGEKREIRQKEIKEGKLSMPKEPAALYVLSAKEDNYNPNTGEFKNSNLRYVLYKPFMTPEETGLSPKPSGSGTPWLMDAGTARSHIMITPANN